MTALLLPTSGVVVLNQLVIGTGSSVQTCFADLCGLQWYWIFDGADVTLANGLLLGQVFAVTVNSVIAITAAGSASATAISSAILLLSAVDVIHAVAIPTLGVKADAIPGRLVSVKISTDHSGSYFGQCSELCGAMHAFMPIEITVISPANDPREVPLGSNYGIAKEIATLFDHLKGKCRHLGLIVHPI